MFSVGDKVRVVDNYEAYTTYSDWVEYYAPRYIHLYNETAHVGVEGVGEIVHIAKHGNHDKLLYLVKGEARISLVEANGLVGVNPLVESSNDTMFNIGDEVKIVNGGKRYSLYTEWVEINAPEYLAHFSDKMHLSNGDVGIVVAIAKHCSQDIYLYLISNGDRVTLVSAQGIKHVGNDTNVRQYTSWEVMRELTEYPDKKFSPMGDPQSIIQIGNDGYIVGSLGNQSLSIYDTWVEANTPVSFMEAFVAFREDRKDIYCVLDGETHKFTSKSIEEYSFGEELIDYGKWYIV